MKRPVTSIVSQPNLQPHGGFIPVKDLTEEQLSDNKDRVSLYTMEQLIDLSCKMGTLSPQTIGLIVDYLTRTEIALFAGATPKEAVFNAFIISVYGAKMANKLDEAVELENKLIEQYSKEKIDYRKIVQVASELVVFDAVFRAGYYNPDLKKTKVSTEDRDAVQLMVGGVKLYLIEKEKIAALGVSFEAKDADNVAPSDADFLTEESLIDLKCSSSKPTSKHTLQLILYYILGLHEFPNEFQKLKYLKIINPRLDKVFSYEVEKLNVEDLKYIEKEIMGYKKSVFDKA